MDPLASIWDTVGLAQTCATGAMALAVDPVYVINGDKTFPKIKYYQGLGGPVKLPATVQKSRKKISWLFFDDITQTSTGDGFPSVTTNKNNYFAIEQQRKINIGLIKSFLLNPNLTKFVVKKLILRYVLFYYCGLWKLCDVTADLCTPHKNSALTNHFYILTMHVLFFASHSGIISAYIKSQFAW